MLKKLQTTTQCASGTILLRRHTKNVDINGDVLTIPSVFFSLSDDLIYGKKEYDKTKNEGDLIIIKSDG